MKIAIIGFSGSGKSTLANFLADNYQLPILHLDSVHWLPNWQERTLEDEIYIVNNFLDNNKKWVIEGNYQKVCFDKRIEQADKIIIMTLPAWQCYVRVLNAIFAIAIPLAPIWEKVAMKNWIGNLPNGYLKMADNPNTTNYTKPFKRFIKIKLLF